MANDNTVKIFNLKDEVLSVASKKNHKWDDSHFNENNEQENDPYGKGDNNFYGHVKLISNAEAFDTYEENASVGVSIAGLKSYFENEMPPIEKSSNEDDENILLTKYVTTQLINDLIEEARTELNTDDIRIVSEDKTLTERLSDIDDTIERNYNPNNIDLTSPKPVTENDNINNLTTAGYYYYNKEESVPLLYNEENIHYENAIIMVERQPDETILQYIYATKKETNDLIYTIDGTKFLRTSNDNGTNWSDLSLIQIPNQSSKEITSHRTGTIITYKETTAGFTFNWKQENNVDYEVQEDLYEYETIGTFAPLPIGDNPYIFGNLIGKVDVKINKNSIAVRSTLPSGNVIKNVNATFFVPRIE